MITLIFKLDLKEKKHLITDYLSNISGSLGGKKYEKELEILQNYKQTFTNVYNAYTNSAKENIRVVQKLTRFLNKSIDKRRKPGYIIDLFDSPVGCQTSRAVSCLFGYEIAVLSGFVWNLKVAEQI
jgi:hypothetical protein